MKILLLEPRNKRLKNKIATYNSNKKTWTIGKSKKEYRVRFSYRLPYFLEKDEIKNTTWYEKHFDEVMNLKNPYFPVKEIEDLRFNGKKLTNTINFYHIDLKKSTTGIWIDRFEVLEY